MTAQKHVEKGATVVTARNSQEISLRRSSRSEKCRMPSDTNDDKKKIVEKGVRPLPLLETHTELHFTGATERKNVGCHRRPTTT